MAQICVFCGSDEVQALGHISQCRNCNAHFDPVSGEIHTVTFGGSPLPTPHIPESYMSDAPDTTIEEVPADPEVVPDPEPEEAPA